MLFNRLVQAIETHSDDIVSSLVNEIRRDPELKRLQALPDSELRQWASAVVTRLSNWLSPHDIAIATYTDLGRHRRQQGIPLHETVREILTLKRTLVDFIREHCFSNTQVELYAEEELEHLVHSCFDRILYHVARGYETAPPQNHAAMAGE